MKKLFLVGVVIGLATLLYAGDNSKAEESAKYSISGQVFDSQNGEALVGVAVMIGEKTQYTDFDGNFTFNEIEAGEYVIETSYVSYDNKKVEVKANPNTEVKIELNSN